jgi:hypothetical protein
MNRVSDFFNRQHSTATYQNIKKLTQAQDRQAAELLNNLVTGSVLSVGGIWEGFEWKPPVKDLTILDLSSEMLKTYAPTPT